MPEKDALPTGRFSRGTRSELTTHAISRKVLPPRRRLQGGAAFSSPSISRRREHHAAIALSRPASAHRERCIKLRLLQANLAINGAILPLTPLADPIVS